MANDRVARIALTASDRKLRQDLARSKRELKTWTRDTSGTIRSGFSTAFGSIAGLASVGGVAAIGKSVLDDSRALTRLAIQAGKSDVAINAFGADMKRLSDATGVGTGELITAAGMIVALTGKFDLAAQSMELLATTSKATGAPMEELGAVVAALVQNMGVEPTELKDALNALTVQGNEGAVEFKDLAGLLAGLTPQFRGLNVELNKGPEALAELGAAMQVAQQGFGTASEAATGLQALFKALTQNADKFKGVKIFEKDPKTGVKTMREFSAIIAEIAASDLAKDPTKLTKAFGSAEAQRAFIQLSDKFETFQDLIRKAKGNDAITAQFERYMTSSAGKIEQAWTRMQNSIARQITPERIDKLSDAAIRLADAVGFAADNWKKFAIAFGAFKVVQFGSAAASLAGNLRKASTNAQGLLGGVSRLGPGLAGAVGQASALTASLFAGYEVGSMLVEQLGLFEDETAVKPTKDDPRGRAGAAKNWQRDLGAAIAELEERRDRVARSLEEGGSARRTGDPRVIEQAEQRLAELNEEISAQKRLFLEPARAEAAALTIFERDHARGTQASDDIIEELRKAVMGMYGDFRPNLRENEVLATFAPELQGRTADELAAIANILERNLQNQEKQTRLLERVASNGPGGGSAPAMHSQIPQTGREPR